MKTRILGIFWSRTTRNGSAEPPALSRTLDRTEKAALASVAVGVLVFALKLAAWRITGSVALLSDALESIVNVAAAAAGLIAIRVARRPADVDHPYGHDKAEYFAAVFEGVLIVLAAVSILRESYAAFLAPRALDAPAVGVAINAAATTINLVWARYLLRLGRNWRSPALTADARHIMTDVWTSAGVLVGLGLAVATGWRWVDPALAAIVAVNILRVGFGMVREAAGGLMDAAPPEEERARIWQIIEAERGGALEAHDLRTRLAGPVTFVEFHLVVPGGMSVDAAHDICDRIEAALRAESPGEMVISIHVEPERKAKHGPIRDR